MLNTPWVRWFLSTAILIGALLASAAPASAQDDDGKRWSLMLSGFFPDPNAEFTVSSVFSDDPVKVDYEDDLLVEDSINALRFQIGVELSRNGRHLLELYYLGISRDGRAMLDEDLEFGDTIFPVNLTVDSEVETRDLDLHYTYLLVKSEGGELGLSIGIHAIEVDTSIRGVLDTGEFEVPVPVAESLNRSFPLPLVGVRGGVNLSDRWNLNGGARLLSLEVDDISGSFLDAWARLEFAISDTVALGAGYSILDADVERDPSENEVAELIQASYEYTGPEVYVRFRF